LTGATALWLNIKQLQPEICIYLFVRPLARSHLHLYRLCANNASAPIYRRRTRAQILIFIADLHCADFSSRALIFIGRLER
jgi:hypothetical protein